MARMSVEVEGLERLLRKLKDVPEPLWDLFGDVIKFAEQQTESGAKPHPGDLGKLSKGNNVRSELSPRGTPLAQLQGRVFTNSPIVVEVDQGRAPGGRMPPIKSMQRWAERHGIDTARRLQGGRRGS